jgi:hypothetical protein
MPYQLLVYGLEGVQFERRGEKIEEVVVKKWSDCFRYSRRYLRGNLGWKKRRVKVMERRQRKAMEVVDLVCFLKNWNLCHEARDTSEYMKGWIRIKRYKRFLEAFHGREKGRVEFELVEYYIIDGMGRQP